MEPITILIYVSIVFLCILWTFLSIILYRIVRILNKIDRILDYVDHVRDLLESWEKIPVKIIWAIIDKIL